MTEREREKRERNDIREREGLMVEKREKRETREKRDKREDEREER